jgi:hypothetical protein
MPYASALEAALTLCRKNKDKEVPMEAMLSYITFLQVMMVFTNFDDERDVARESELAELLLNFYVFSSFFAD